VTITTEASIAVAYINGVAVLTETLVGLMYEASIEGRHFTYKSFK